MERAMRDVETRLLILEEQVYAVCRLAAFR